MILFLSETHPYQYWDIHKPFKTLLKALGI